MHISRSHRYGLALFVLLNLADLLMTWYLIERSKGIVYESNPLAAWWLQTGGWLGLAAFKAGVVLLAGSLILIVSLQRPHLGHGALGLSCAVVAGVVFYSGWLAGVSRSHEEQLQEMVTQKDLLQEEGERLLAFRNTLIRLTDDLIAGRSTLKKAVQHLEQSTDAQLPLSLQGTWRSKSAQSQEEWLARILMNRVCDSSGSDAQKAREALGRLKAEYHEQFGQPFPDRCLSPRPSLAARPEPQATRQLPGRSVARRAVLSERLRMSQP